ncbi:MAG: hypothetical protein QG670_2294, partial [Thermoproteota archaeon]|nr:hypothetical protein [Thermoproteota archaeon]
LEYRLCIHNYFNYSSYKSLVNIGMAILVVGVSDYPGEPVVGGIGRK